MAAQTTSGEQNEAQLKESPPPPLTADVKLRRSLGLWNGVSIIVGVMIGSGIFVSPRGVLAQAGSVGASLIVWSLCGILALFGALCFAELGTSIGASGGEYTYINLAYGPTASFLYIWVLAVVIMPCANAISALTFANYVLQPIYSDCKPPDGAIRLVALAILLLLIYVNCASVDTSIKLQNSFTTAKVLALVVIIAYGGYFLFCDLIEYSKQNNQNPTGDIDASKSAIAAESLWAGTQASLPHLAQAFYAAFYTYSGWSSLNCVTEEIKNPTRNLPGAIVISITLVTLIYTLTNVAYFAVLSKAQILGADAIAVQFGLKTMPLFTWLMPAAVALSTMSGLNGSIFAASRIYFAGSRQGQLFSALQMINVNNLTPIPSILFMGLLSTFYLFTTSILSLINYMVFVEATFFALAVSSMLVLRLKQPQLVRPLKIPCLIPIIYLAFSLVLLILPLWSSPVETLIGLAILLTGLPVYYFTAHWKVKPANYQRSLDWLNGIIQRLTLSVVPDAQTSALLKAQ